jgi:hypothetical protein
MAGLGSKRERVDQSVPPMGSVPPSGPGARWIRSLRRNLVVILSFPHRSAPIKTNVGELLRVNHEREVECVRWTAIAVHDFSDVPLRQLVVGLQLPCNRYLTLVGPFVGIVPKATHWSDEAGGSIGSTAPPKNTCSTPISR